MPIYEYRCEKCQHKFETIVLSAREKIKCPNCDSGLLTKQLSLFSSPATHAEANGGSGCACTPQTCGCH